MVRLLSDCPELASSSWINCLGPTSEWGTIACEYSTRQLEWLIRVMVTAERELGWKGGSVASAVELFRIYQQRDDADVDRLSDWMLRNRGNDWLPFGSHTGARSLDEWRREQSRNARRYADHVERQASEQQTKEERARERKNRTAQRKKQSAMRKEEIATLIRSLDQIDPVERLRVIASNDALPFGALPEALIATSLDGVDGLDYDLCLALLHRIDRRRRGSWKNLHKALEVRCRSRGLSRRVVEACQALFRRLGRGASRREHA